MLFRKLRNAVKKRSYNTADPIFDRQRNVAVTGPTDAGILWQDGETQQFTSFEEIFRFPFLIKNEILKIAQEKIQEWMRIFHQELEKYSFEVFVDSLHVVKRIVDMLPFASSEMTPAAVQLIARQVGDFNPDVLHAYFKKYKDDTQSQTFTETAALMWNNAKKKVGDHDDKVPREKLKAALKQYLERVLYIAQLIIGMDVHTQRGELLDPVAREQVMEGLMNSASNNMNFTKDIEALLDSGRHLPTLQKNPATSTHGNHLPEQNSHEGPQSRGHSQTSMEAKQVNAAVRSNLLRTAEKIAPSVSTEPTLEEETSDATKWIKSKPLQGIFSWRQHQFPEGLVHTWKPPFNPRHIRDPRRLEKKQRNSRQSPALAAVGNGEIVKKPNAATSTRGESFRRNILDRGIRMSSRA